jgi:phosphoribosylanthranilate isomerase
MSKIKICGLTRQEDIMAVNEYLPDYIGFVFAESRRQVTEERAKQLKQLLLPCIKAVGYLSTRISDVSPDSAVRASLILFSCTVMRMRSISEAYER